MASELHRYHRFWNRTKIAIDRMRLPVFICITSRRQWFVQLQLCRTLTFDLGITHQVKSNFAAPEGHVRNCHISLERKFNPLSNDILNVEIGPFVQRFQRQMACYSFFCAPCRNHHLLDGKQLRRRPHFRFAFDESIRASVATPENFHYCLDGNALRNSLNRSIGLELSSK